MNDGGGFVYEVTYERDPPRKTNDGSALAEAVIDWSTSEGVADFRAFTATDRRTGRLRIQFVTQEALEAFLERDAHAEHLDRLRSACTSVETACWQEGAVSLVGDEVTVTTPMLDATYADGLVE